MLQVHQNLTRKHRILDAGDDPHRAAAGGEVSMSFPETHFRHASSILSNPPPLFPPHHRRPRRQLEQRHLRRQRLVQDGSDNVGCERGRLIMRLT
jgi:hypothetical protein